MKFKAEKANGAIKAVIPIKGNGSVYKNLTHALAAFGFLIPWNSTVTGPEFAELIRDYSSDNRSQMIADIVAKS